MRSLIWQRFIKSYVRPLQNYNCIRPTRINIEMGMRQELSSFEFPITIHQTALCLSLEERTLNFCFRADFVQEEADNLECEFPKFLIPCKIYALYRQSFLRIPLVRIFLYIDSNIFTYYIYLYKYLYKCIYMLQNVKISTQLQKLILNKTYYHIIFQLCSQLHVSQIS